MELLQPYIGKYISAESAENKIDISTILSGCDEVDSEAGKISEVNSKINNIGSDITSDALSIDGITIDDKLNECCEGINNTETYILNSTSQIRSMAQAAYNQIQLQYNEEAEVKDLQAIKQKESSKGEK